MTRKVSLVAFLLQVVIALFYWLVILPWPRGGGNDTLVENLFMVSGFCFLALFPFAIGSTMLSFSFLVLRRSPYYRQKILENPISLLIWKELLPPSIDEDGGNSK